MILHLLLSFKSLLALRSRTFKFVGLMNGYIMLKDFFGWWKGWITYLTRLNKPLYTTFVPKVWAAKLLIHLCVRSTLGSRTIVIWVNEANEEGLATNNWSEIVCVAHLWQLILIVFTFLNRERKVKFLVHLELWMLALHLRIRLWSLQIKKHKLAVTRPR